MKKKRPLLIYGTARALNQRKDAEKAQEEAIHLAQSKGITVYFPDTTKKYEAWRLILI